MPAPRKASSDLPDEVADRIKQLEDEVKALAEKVKAFLDAFAELDEHRSRSVRETLAAVKHVAAGEPTADSE